MILTTDDLQQHFEFVIIRQATKQFKDNLEKIIFGRVTNHSLYDFEDLLSQTKLSKSNETDIFINGIYSI